MIYLAERQGSSEFLRLIRKLPLLDAHSAWSMATTIHRETKALGLTFPLFVFLERDELATRPLRLSGDRVETVEGRVLAGRVLVREGRRDALVFRD